MPTNTPQQSQPISIDVPKRLDDLVKSVELVQRKADDLDEVRATLIVNFKGERGKQYGLEIDQSQSTRTLLVSVLEHFIEVFKEKRERLCLIGDGDGHWFMVPSGKKEEANRYFEKLGEFWDADEAKRDGLDYPEEPDWLRPINGPHTLTFTDPQDDFS